MYINSRAEDCHAYLSGKNMHKAKKGMQKNVFESIN